MQAEGEVVRLPTRQAEHGIDGWCATGGRGDPTRELNEEPFWFGNDTLIV
jgi:hypothetical protein